MVKKSSSRATGETALLVNTQSSDGPDQYASHADIESKSLLDNEHRSGNDDDDLPELPDLDERGLVKLFTLSYFSILVQYIAVGLYYGFFSGTLFPIFSGLYGLPSFRVKAALQSINIFWSFKTFFACVSDSWPIFGYRRKYYVLIGWVLAGLCTLLAAVVVGQPDQSDSPFPLIILFSGCTCMYLIGDVAMDGFVISLAQREPLESRGSLQSTIYLARYCAMIFSSIVITFGFNSEEYGGTFEFGLKLPWYLYFLFAANVAGWFFYYKMYDTPNQKAHSYIQHFIKMFRRLELLVVAKIILFSFFVHLFAYVSNAASVDIQRQLCSVTPLWDGIGNQILSYLAMSVAIWFTRRYLLNVSWHLTLTICIVFMAFGTYLPALLIDLNVIRAPAFAAMYTLFPTLVQGVFFIVCSLAAVEIAEKGAEGITFGLVTTINNITNPLTTLISGNILAQFEIYGADGRSLRDTVSSRMELVKLDTIIFCLQMLALFSLALLPPQKIELKAELDRGKRSPLLAKVIGIGLIICFVYALAGNFAQSNESTSCLTFFGGKGCHD